MDAHQKLDTVLEFYQIRYAVDSFGVTGTKLIYEHLKTLCDCSFKEVADIANQLEKEGLIDSWPENDIEATHKINYKGISFIALGGFIEKSRREKLEFELKGKQLTKLNWDIDKMKTVYVIAVIGLIISILNLIGINIPQILKWVNELSQQQ